MLGQGSKTIYLSIVGGKFARKSTATDHTATARINKKNETVYENLFNYVEGVIQDITFKTGNYGEELIISLQDGEENYSVQVSASSANAKSFLRALPNVNFSTKVRLNPWSKEVMNAKTNKMQTKSAIYLNQGGKDSIQWYFTKENPNGMPDMVQVKVKGVLTWDDSDQLEFLKKYVTDNVIPKLGKGVPKADKQPAETSDIRELAQYMDKDKDDSGLPF